MTPHRRRRCATSASRCRMTAPPSTCSGAAVYIDDIREPAGTLHVAVGGSPVARGTFARHRSRRGASAPGVVAVLTAARHSGQERLSPVRRRRAGVRRRRASMFHGQAAVRRRRRRTRDAARRAARLGEVEIEAGAPTSPSSEALASGERVSARLRLRATATRPRRSPRRRCALAGALRIGGQEHFLSRRPGRARRAGRGRRHAGLFLDPASERGAAPRRPRARRCRTRFVTVEVRRMGGGFGGKETQATQWAVDRRARARASPAGPASSGSTATTT